MLFPFLLPAQTSQVLVHDGVTDWVIVAKGASPALQHGAQELQTFIQQMSGARLPIESDTSAGGKEILIRQDDSLSDEAFTIKSTQSGIVISGGGKRGAMYGCYGLLQDVLGCRWFTRTVSRIPKRPTITFTELHISERPAFEYREPYFGEAFEKDWDVRNRVNGTSMPLDDSVGGKVAYGRFVHTFSELVPPEKYFKDHPEYFSLVNGKRQDGYAQLCLTNPDVLKIVVAGVKQWIKDNPKATIFSVSQNDTYMNCQCENCKKIEKEEDAPSGPLLRFVNQVADEVGKEYPNVLIDTLAYQWSEKPPLHERPRKNVRVRIAPLGACFAHPLDACASNKAPYDNLTAWSKITNQLYVWHYCTNFSHYLQPLPDLDELAGDPKVFKTHGIVGVFYEGDTATGSDMAELKSYLLARLLWNPDLPVQPLIDEFTDAVYGAAASDIRVWLDLVHKAVRSGGVHATVYDPPTAAYFTPELLSEGDSIFRDAEAKVADDLPALEEVKHAHLGLLYVEFMRTPDSAPNKKELGQVLAEGIRHFAIPYTSEGGSSEAFLKSIGQ